MYVITYAYSIVRNIWSPACNFCVRGHVCVVLVHRIHRIASHRTQTLCTWYIAYVFLIFLFLFRAVRLYRYIGTGIRILFLQEVWMYRREPARVLVPSSCAG